MIILKNKNKILKKANVSFIAIVFILTSVSTIILFTTPVRACESVGTFESDYITSKTTFIQGGIVYGKGTDYTPKYLKLKICDPSDNIVNYSNPVFGTQVICSWVLDEDAPTGEWNIQVGELNGDSWHWSLIAYFEVVAQPEYTLAININSLGTVTKDPDQTNYTSGTLVQLSANPYTGWTFSHWSGDLNSNNNPETIIMTSDKNITAHFKKESTNGGGSNGGGTSKGGGVENDDSRKGTAENIPPIADLSASEPYKGFVNSEITFNGSLSYDPDGYILSWEWDFGDGSNGEGETATHSYLIAGIYTAILTVTDDKGATNLSELLILIIQPNRSPSNPEINGPTLIKKSINYNYTMFSLDDDNDYIKYIIDWGDGTIDTSEFLPNGTIFTKTHKWTTTGNQTVKVTANDNLTVTSSEMTVFVEEPEPEEDNLVLIALALLAFILLILSFIFIKRYKDKK